MMDVDLEKAEKAARKFCDADPRVYGRVTVLLAKAVVHLLDELQQLECRVDEAEYRCPECGHDGWRRKLDEHGNCLDAVYCTECASESPLPDHVKRQENPSG